MIGNDIKEKKADYLQKNISKRTVVSKTAFSLKIFSYEQLMVMNNDYK
jgi:hypothetical protein